MEYEQTESINEKIAGASKTLFSYCMARTPNRQEAEDLCQDILCELLSASGNIRDSRAFYGFMWAVAGNVYKQWCRKRVRLQTCELTEDIPAMESVPEEIVIGEENSDLYLLRRELALLSDEYRQAVILYYINQKSCSEISRILSVSESRIKYLLFKSRKILKEGMSMERRLGTLSYDPGNFVPMYNGTGPNLFWDFMQSKIRQNIVNACYNDSLTEEQISLETGIPLAYLDSEIDALTEKNILIREGFHYKGNIIVFTAQCANEIIRTSAPYHEKIAGLMADFAESNLSKFRQIGFAGADFTDNTLRWQMMIFLLREIADFNVGECENEVPLTAWGDRAYLWLVEEGNALSQPLFNFCQVESRWRDRISFMDYLPRTKGDHHDFYGNEYYINILCDIARGSYDNFSEYDLEAVAELIKKGYVLKENDQFTVAIPLFTAAQYADAAILAGNYVAENLGGIIKELNCLFTGILREHTPKHLQKQISGISSTNQRVNAGCIPLSILIEKRILSTDWNPAEMPTIHIELGTQRQRADS